MFRLALCVLSTLPFFATAGRADTVALGAITFDVFIPGGIGSPGVNDFSIDGFPGLFGLPPDFPASDPLIFLNSSTELSFSATSVPTPNKCNRLLGVRSRRKLLDIWARNTTNALSKS